MHSKYLCKPAITPRALSEGMSVVDLVDHFSASGAFNAGRLAEACKLFAHFTGGDATVALTVAGAMTPTGMGGVVRTLVERGLIDVIISTGANLYHDLHFALELPVHQGDFRVDDTELLKDGVVRIYDVFITEKALLDTDAFVRSAIEDSGLEGLVTSAKLHEAIGRHTLKHAPHPERSLLAFCAECGVPVYTSSPGDSSIGMNVALLKMLGGKVTVDPDQDVLDTAALVHAATQNAVIIVGGGSPKNFYLQTQPMLWQMLDVPRGGHDYFIQLTTDAPHWGGLSGATPSEAVSWGKINPEELQKTVVVYGDATISLPILGAYGVGQGRRRPLKRLLNHLPRLRADLDSAFRARRKGK